LKDGEGMSLKNISITMAQIDNMKHALGFANKRVKGLKYRRYQAYRNYYATAEGCDGFEGLVDLSDKGLMLERQVGDKTYFHVSELGFEFLSKLTGVTITDTADDL
jgi:hypothetical protein